MANTIRRLVDDIRTSRYNHPLLFVGGCFVIFGAAFLFIGANLFVSPGTTPLMAVIIGGTSALAGIIVGGLFAIFV